MQLAKHLLSMMTILMFCSQASAAEHEDTSEDAGIIENEEIIEVPGNIQGELDALQGVVFNRTITQTGFFFYQEFTRLWLADKASVNHTLTIRETPTATQGNIIWIEEGSQLLHRLSINLRARDTREKAATSLQLIRSKIGVAMLTSNLQ